MTVGLSPPPPPLPPHAAATSIATAATPRPLRAPLCSSSCVLGPARRRDPADCASVRSAYRPSRRSDPARGPAYARHLAVRPRRGARDTPLARPDRRELVAVPFAIRRPSFSTTIRSATPHDQPQVVLHDEDPEAVRRAQLADELPELVRFRLVRAGRRLVEQQVWAAWPAPARSRRRRWTPYGSVARPPVRDRPRGRSRRASRAPRAGGRARRAAPGAARRPPRRSRARSAGRTGGCSGTCARPRARRSGGRASR